MLSDDFIRKLVLSKPIPDKLIANLRKAPELDPYRASRYARGTLTERLERTLELVVCGYSNREIAEMTHYSEEAVKDHVKRLLAIYHARNRTHLAALVVAESFR